MLTPFENGWSTYDFLLLSFTICIDDTLTSTLYYNYIVSMRACKIATWYFFGDLELFVPWYGIFHFGYCFNKFEKRYTKSFMLGIAFMTNYGFVSFYKTSVKSILSVTVSTQKKAAYFFAFSSNSSKYLSKSDIKSLSWITDTFQILSRLLP